MARILQRIDPPVAEKLDQQIVKILRARADVDLLGRDVDAALAMGGQVRIFGKEASRAGRRLAVALAEGGDVADARARATAMAGAMRVVGRTPGATTPGGSMASLES